MRIGLVTKSKRFLFGAVGLIVTVALVFVFFPIKRSYATTETFTASQSWSVPAGVASITVETWGAGGGGGTQGPTSGASGGGGGGAYAASTFSVSPGAGYEIVIGAAGAAASNGGNTFFGPDTNQANAIVLAEGGKAGTDSAGGGTGGAGGGTTVSIGDTEYTGGTGGSASGGNSGGGGGGAGSTGGGGNGGAPTAGTGTTENGGNGGTGVTNADGNPGNNYGGGGAGAARTNGNRSGGAGAPGYVRITYSADVTAPTPNPPYFTTAPAATTTDVVRMVSVTMTDTASPVQYNFTAVTGSCGSDIGTGGTNSGWQTSAIYNDTGLQANKCYAYVVAGKDSLDNVTSSSSASSTYTRAAIPGALTFGSVTPTSFTITNDENGNPTSNPATTFAVYATSSDSTWNQKYVDSAGNPTGTKTWLTDGQLTNLTIDNLTMNTEYRFVVIARNQNNIETATSTMAATTTLLDATAPTPNPPYFTAAPNAAAANQLNMTSVTVSDAMSSNLEYYFTSNNTGCGADVGTGGDNSGWQSSASYTDGGLQINKCYGYTVTARDEYGNKTATSTASTSYTLAAVPGALSYSGVTASAITLSNDAGTNPTSNPATTFAVYATSSDGTWNQKYVNSSGNPTDTKTWLTDSQIDGLTLSGLSDNTEYRFVVIARNQDNIETATSTMSATTTLVAADTTPPTPNPLTFEQASGIPTNASISQIDMTANTASDPSTPISYYFTNDNTTCGADAGSTGGDDSGWQSADVTYSDSGLETNKCYGYKVTARDSAGNKTATSTASTTYTSANTPGAPSLGTAGASTLTLVNDENTNPASNPATTFAVFIVSTAPSDTSHDSKYIDGSGNPSDTAVWLTDSQIEALTITGLNPSTTYTFQVKARNADGDETAFGTSAGLSTTAAVVQDHQIRFQGGAQLHGGTWIH